MVVGQIDQEKYTRKRYSRYQIDGTVKNILEVFQITTYPVDPLLIAGKFNIDVKEATFVRSDVSGMIEKNGNDFKIIVAASDSAERKRFSIAHELGHYFLHYHGEEGKKFQNIEKNHVSYRDNVSTLGYSTKEIEANHFAAALLMPKEEVERVYSKHCGEGVFSDDVFNKVVSEVANHFWVSKLAASIRLESLGLYNG